MRILRLILLCILLISGGFLCYKEELVGEFYQSEEMKNQIPFNGYEKITFLRDSLFSIHLTASERKDSVYKYYTDEDESEYIYCERSNISFTCNDYSIFLGMGACPFDGSGVGFNFFYLEGKYNFLSYYDYRAADSTEQFLDSLLVNGKWVYNILYDSVEYLVTKPFPNELPQYPIKSYYSKTLGVVKIDFSDNSSWELKEIVWK